MTTLLINVEDWPDDTECKIEVMLLVRSQVENWGIKVDTLPVTLLAKQGSIAEMRKHLNETAPKTRRKKS